MRRLDIVITPDDRLGGSFAGVRPQREAQKAAPQSTPKPRPKRKPARWRLAITPVQKFAALGVVVTAVLVAGAVVWRSGAPSRMIRDTGNAALASTAQMGLRIGEITVAGRRRTPTDQVVTALAAHHGDPILGLDIGAAKARLEALPSVRAAAVERRLPGALHLSIVERQPVALWQSEGRFVLVDRDGHQIPGAIEGFEDLPLVVGDGAPQRVEELFVLLSAEPEMAARVKAATRVGNRRWNVRLDDVEKGLEVRLPELDTESAWHRLAELEKRRGLTSKQITMIDLRVAERLILKSDQQQAAERRTPSDSRKED
ncbi:cell division protein [Paramagnetospirillum kuznetsovii]|uniref:Cell division protein FtsQ n=1 Tax=Paramagnetospirillum kuznetsovii TaxID=2053833 RepID=A0A364P1B9_9PROT|nr:cell division protein FtsQ/DivIB [Paramagnetospirillum kuznetsovii]RAU22915.1 cell division protein [Paramagnetospirillum kuznetsovii]